MRRRRAWRCNENLLLLQRDAMESNVWSVFLIDNLQCVLKGENSANHYTAVPVCLPPHENIMRVTLSVQCIIYTLTNLLYR